MAPSRPEDRQRFAGESLQRDVRNGQATLAIGKRLSRRAGGRPTRATRGRREPEASPVFVVLCFWSIFGPFLTVLQCQANPW